MSNRSDTEQVLHDLFTNYRASSTTSLELVNMAMTALDERNVFVRHAKTANTEAPTSTTAYVVPELTNLSLSLDGDDGSSVYLWCNACEEAACDYDNVDGWTISDLISAAIQHWQASHD